MTLRLGRWDDSEGLTPRRQSRRWGQDEKLKRTRCIPLIPTLFKRILILRCRADHAVTPKTSGHNQTGTTNIQERDYA